MGAISLEMDAVINGAKVKEVKADDFKIRASQIGRIMGGSIGLTDIQKSTLSELEDRFNGNGRPLTANMEKERLKLIEKRDNPELPQGSKTYCKQWLKETRFKRRAEIRSKFIDKGNECEEDGFTLMAIVLGLGMVYKNEQFFEDEHICGTPDLILSDQVIDNKCSWNLDSFPMYESEVPEPDYWYQLQGYMALTGMQRATLAYTLVDAPVWMVERELEWSDNKFNVVNNMVFTQKTFEYFGIEDKGFVPIPNKDRVKTFNIERMDSVITDIRTRVELCRNYIYTLLS